MQYILKNAVEKHVFSLQFLSCNILQDMHREASPWESELPVAGRMLLYYRRFSYDRITAL